VAAAEGVPVVIDDVAAELGFPGSQVPPVPLGDAVITVGSLSKVVWGGLRIGWIRAAGAGHRPARPVARRARHRRRHPSAARGRHSGRRPRRGAGPASS